MLFKKIFLLKNWRVVKFLLQNLTRCRKVDSKPDKMKNFYFTIMLFTKTFSFKIMLFRKKFTFKIMLFRNFFSTKSCFFKIARNTQKMLILRGKLNQNVLLCVQHFFQNLLFKINFFFKIVLFRKFSSSKTCFLKLHVIRKKCDIYGVNWIKTWFFCVQHFPKSAF